MSIPSKTTGTSVLAMQSIATGTLVISSAVVVTDLFSARLAIRFGRAAATALTTAVGFQVEWSAHASDDRAWNPYFPAFITTDTAAAESEAVSGTVAAGATTITLASTTNLTAGELISIVNSTAANSEIRRIKTVTTNTNVTVDALVNAATSGTVYDQAQIISLYLDLAEIERIRLIVDVTTAGQTVVCEAVLNSLDSVG